jgi:hypothetical protein
MAMADPATVATIHAAISGATAVILVIGIPLLGYVVKMKDREVRELWAKLDAFKKASDQHDETAAHEREALRERCHTLDLKAAELAGEVRLTNELKTDVRHLITKVDKIAQDVAGLLVRSGHSRSAGSTGRSVPPRSG